MTVKQVIVATILGAGALAALLNRLPKAAEPKLAIKPSQEQAVKTARSPRHAHRKHATEERLSFNKMFG